MALIKCPECGKEISNKAVACPNCGVPIASTQTPNMQPEIRVTPVINTPMNNSRIKMGKEIKEGMKGLNTSCSPKSKEICVMLTIIPFISLPIALIGGLLKLDVIIEISLPFVLLSGMCNFYVGKFKKGLLYTFTIGFLYIGLLIDLFQLKVTGTFEDANSFPVIY